MPHAHPLPVGSCTSRRPAAHLVASSSPARPWFAAGAGASKVSQKAAEARPHPGPPDGPWGASTDPASLPGGTVPSGALPSATLPSGTLPSATLPSVLFEEPALFDDPQ